MAPFILALSAVFLGFMFGVLAPLFDSRAIPIWSLWLLGLSSLLLLASSIFPAGKKAINNWRKKNLILLSMRIVTFIVIALILALLIFTFLFGVFFAPELRGSYQNLQEITLAVFGLLVAGAGLCFGALRAFAIFKPDDFKQRKQKYDFEELNKKLFLAGTHLFYAAVLLSVATILKLGSDSFMEVSTNGANSVPVMDFALFTVGFISNIFAFFLVAGTIFQTISGVFKVLDGLEALAGQPQSQSLRIRLRRKSLSQPARLRLALMLSFKDVSLLSRLRAMCLSVTRLA